MCVCVFVFLLRGEARGLEALVCRSFGFDLASPAPIRSIHTAGRVTSEVMLNDVWSLSPKPSALNPKP